MSTFIKHRKGKKSVSIMARSGEEDVWAKRRGFLEVSFQLKSKGQMLLLKAVVLHEARTQTLPVQKITAYSPDMSTL